MNGAKILLKVKSEKSYKVKRSLMCFFTVEAATGAAQSCGGRSWRDANNTDIGDDSSQRRQQQQEQELVDAVNKLQQKLIKLRAE